MQSSAPWTSSPDLAALERSVLHRPTTPARVQTVVHEEQLLVERVRDTRADEAGVWGVWVKGGGRCAASRGVPFFQVTKKTVTCGGRTAPIRAFSEKKSYRHACAGWVIYPGVAMKQCCGRRKGFGFATQSVVCKKNRFQGGHGSATFYRLY